MTPGVFDARIVAIGLKSSQNGNPGVWVTVDIDDGYGATEEMTGTIWITTAALGMARGQFKAIGFDYKTQVLNFENLQVCIDHECQVTLKEETYKNRTELKISVFGSNAPPSPEALAAATSALRAGKDDEERLPPKTLPKQPRTHGEVPSGDPVRNVEGALHPPREPGLVPPGEKPPPDDGIPF
jgi:hypothetical protein